MAAALPIGDAEAVAALEARDARELLRFVVVGSVDDGKSTLIGRLLYENGGLFEDQIAQVRRASKRGGDIDFSLFTDGLKAEREQGITIDVAYRYFSTARRHFVIADTPGHEQYTRNMATGASTAELAIILLDARLGVLPQSRRHATIASILGIPRLAVAINKMDLMGFEQAVFDRHCQAFGDFAARLGFEEIRYFPIVAPDGDGIVTAGTRMPWYTGPSLMTYLETSPVGSSPVAQPFRLPVQRAVRPHLTYRGFAGRIASGQVAVGDEIVALPSGRKSRVQGIDTFSGSIARAFAPMSVTVRLEDEIDVSRGSVLCHPATPAQLASRLEATLVWFSDRPLDPARGYLLKHASLMTPTRIEKILGRLDLVTLASAPADRLELNDIGQVRLRTNLPQVFDPYAENRAMGAFILIDALTNATVGAGTLSGATRETSDGDASPRVTPEERALRLGHRAAVVIGVASQGSAEGLERSLFDAGVWATVVGELSHALACARAGAVAILVGAPHSGDTGEIPMVDATDSEEALDLVLRAVR